MTPAADRTEIGRAFDVLYPPGALVEIRALKTPTGTCSGYFNDREKFIEAAVTMNGHGPGTYATINPVEPALRARASNRIRRRAEVTTSDRDVVQRCWIPLDFDPIRPTGISSTETEHAAALAAARAARTWLASLGVPGESMVLADSGNGAHLLLHVALPNDEPTTRLVERCLDAVALYCSTPDVAVDRGVFNAGRIMKLYGTVAMKGDATAERPHRRAQLLEVPAVLVVVPVPILERIAATLPADDPRDASPGRRGEPTFNVRTWLAAHGLGIRREKPWHSGATVLELAACPFNGEHVGSAVVILEASGRLLFRCLHDSCRDKLWRHVRDCFEPGRSQARSRPHRPTPTMGEAEAADAIHLTDLGNARRLVHAFGENIRYCKPWRSWFCWDDRRWLRDERQQVMRYAKRITEALFREATATRDTNLRAELRKHAERSERADRLRAMVTLAESEPGIPITPADFDRDPYVLTVLNGTIELRTGALRAHERDDLITKLAPVVYDPGAQHGLWDRFLRDVTAGLEPTLDALAASGAYRDFLQRAVGYTLTGDVSEEVFFLLNGPEASGKSTFIKAILKTLGDYAKTADFETFLVKRGDAGVRNDLAALVGARLVASIEVDEGKELAQGLVKHLTGGDVATARFLYAEFFEFEPAFKLWLVVNHAPRVQDLDAALWRRIRRLPFEFTVPKERRDPAVKRTLTNPRIAGPAILAWAVQGCLDWQAHGLEPPAIVEAATAQYRAEQDPLGDFYEECCVFAFDAWVASKELYEAYIDWTKRTGIRHPLSAQLIGRRLRERNCTDDSRKFPRPDGRRTSVRGWKGIGLQTDVEEAGD
jgi:putative DNA primase/helicase